MGKGGLEGSPRERGPVGFGFEGMGIAWERDMRRMGVGGEEGRDQGEEEVRLEPEVDFVAKEGRLGGGQAKGNRQVGKR